MHIVHVDTCMKQSVDNYGDYSFCKRDSSAAMHSIRDRMGAFKNTVTEEYLVGRNPCQCENANNSTLRIDFSRCLLWLIGSRIIIVGRSHFLIMIGLIQNQSAMSIMQYGTLFGSTQV